MDPMRSNSHDRNTYGDVEPNGQGLPELSLPNRSNTFPLAYDDSSNQNPDGRPHQHRKQSSLDSPTTHQIGNGSEELLGPARNRTHKKKATSRICGKCGQPLLGQFVRALGDTYHLECFTCEDCGKIVASKFFPVPEQPPGQYPLCETDYFRRLDLLCFSCGGALRGSYITALERKYHIEHFTCSVCPTVFGAQDSYYEHEGSVYCHYHYSTKFAQRCNGCQTAILKQFVEIFRNGQNQHWHPECYMIHKYWNVRLHQGGSTLLDRHMTEEEATEEMRKAVKDGEEKVEEKVLWIWRTLSSFEEKSATCISDMLLHVSNGAYVDGVMSAKKFITHVDLLFSAADDLDWVLTTHTAKGLSYSREAKLLCKKVVAFFQLLAESQETGVRRLGVTQELLSLVTGLAHYLKLLIRICLQGALKLEREADSVEGLNCFLADIGKLDDRLDVESQRDSRGDMDAYVSRSADSCGICEKPVEDKCFKRNDRLVHINCLNCSKCGRPLADSYKEARWSEALRKVFCDRHAGLVGNSTESGFTEVTRLQQYVYLLRVAHARLLATLRTSGALPHTSDDPNLSDYDSTSGHRAGRLADPPLLRSDTRSKSYAGSTPSDQKSGGYEDTMTDIRRLRSTRMDKQLSSTSKKARTSRIVDAPDAMSSGGPAGRERRRTGTFQIIEDRDANGEPITQLSFGNNESMTLDDIPRLVQAQQNREQRPNASKYARAPMSSPDPKVQTVNGHNREPSGDFDQKIIATEGTRTKKYFSELSALEYFIVRHVAVLSMEPLLEGHFNQEQLLDLIETKRPTFWGKFGSAFKNDKNKNKGKKKGVFGVALDQLIERDYAESTDGVGPGALRIPAVVQDSVSAMKTMDMSVEGVFRKNGNIKRLNETKEEIDKNGAMDFDLTKENPVQVAALLKRFLRDLPDPLLTHKLHKLWITSSKIADDDKRRRVLHLTCCLLPKAHRDTMEVLFAFLNWTASFSQVDEDTGSKMDIHNLATVVSPNILTPGTLEVPVDDSFLAIEAIHTLIECNEAMCEIPEDISLILNDSGLFSSSADITTKEILKRYGDRARVPVATPSIVNPALDPSSPRPQEGSRTNITPAATRVEPDQSQLNAWQNESSVRHVKEETGGQSALGTPQMSYNLRNDSTESHGGSPNRNRFNGPGSGNRAVGVT